MGVLYVEQRIRSWVTNTLLQLFHLQVIQLGSYAVVPSHPIRRPLIILNGFGGIEAVSTTASHVKKIVNEKCTQNRFAARVFSQHSIY